MNRLPKMLFASAVLSLSLVSPAAPIRIDEQSDEKALLTARIRIENFGKVNDRFYRGSLPKQPDYAARLLQTLGTRPAEGLRLRLLSPVARGGPIKQQIDRG